MNRNSIKYLLLIICPLSLFSCATDDEAAPKEIRTATVNPAVCMYIEDFDGNDLLAENQSASVSAVATGEFLPFTVEQSQLPWGGNGSLLVFTPASPYHDADDPEYVYTIDPQTSVNIGGMNPITLQRTFDYDLRRYDTEGGRGVDVSYTPKSTLLCGYDIKNDTVHIIMENGYPSLRVEGDMLTVEMRFQPVEDSLAYLPLTLAGEMEWNNDLLNFRLFFSGRTIAHPYATVTTANHKGQDVDDSYFALTVNFRLPYIYSGGYGFQMFNYSYIIVSPLLFGDSYEHSLELGLADYRNTGTVQFSLVRKDMQTVDDPYFAAPNHIIADWRSPKNSN